MIFSGETSCSKSLMNRALIAQSYFPEFKVTSCDSKNLESEDVRHLRNALKHLSTAHSGSGLRFDCGEGGTTFRFLALRVSRIPGTHLLTLHPRLRERPHADLIKILSLLGVHSEFQGNDFVIKTEGWQKPTQAIPVSRKVSSQFASALLLNGWNLEFDLPLDLSGDTVSDDYFEMSMRFCREMGMKVLENGSQLTLLKNQKVLSHEFEVEMDLSSLFVMAAAAALDGELTTEKFPIRSLQPDSKFVEILPKMSIPLYYSGNSLQIRKAEKLTPISVDLNNSPDLFPVLAVLCAFAGGESELSGATQLIHKESNRIAKTKELLQLVGIESQKIEGGLKIFGGTPHLKQEIEFDPDHDHRMAMAAGLLRLMGLPVRILTPEVVSKSFPDFWKALGVSAC